ILAAGAGAGHGGHTLPGGYWTPLVNQPPFKAVQMQLLTDGSVLVGQSALPGPSTPLGNVWMPPMPIEQFVWKLIPDINGSYVNGTWVKVASMLYQHGRCPIDVLADGHVLAYGGENIGNTSTNKCETYDPIADVWTDLPAPLGWTWINWTEGAVLPDGRFFGTQAQSGMTALLDPVSLTWSAGASGKWTNSEWDTWTLLPNGTLLDVQCRDAPGCQVYNIAGNSWKETPPLPVNLYDGSAAEFGPAMLLPNGKVFQMGTNTHSCVYDPSSGTWTVGPDSQPVNGVTVGGSGGSAALLPNGHVLMSLAAYPRGVYPDNGWSFEYDGASIYQVASAPNMAGTEPSRQCLLLLPTGQVLSTHRGDTDAAGDQMFAYTPDGTYDPSWQPTVSTVAGTIHAWSINNPISGTQFNGLSQAHSSGFQELTATNYPLVRIQNNATGHVFYCRTHDHSTMAVATGSTPVSTLFDVPSGIEIGPSKLYVVANGIPSAAQPVNVVSPGVVLPSTFSLFRGVLSGGGLSSLFFADGNTLNALTGPTLNPSEAPIQLVVSGTTTVTSPTSFSFTVTAKMNTPGIAQSVSLWNYSTGTYDVLDTRAIGTSNLSVTVTPGGSLSRYVGPGGAVQARIAYVQTGPTLVFRWAASVDLSNWLIQ
ncbi:MAG TPA: kelch repeat-containing protein, partial [Fimbriimonadaceae bacterium]|nr:kelch repeat-containing protein [Fimbriimonadaceae bacterium]